MLKHLLKRIALTLIFAFCLLPSVHAQKQTIDTIHKVQKAPVPYPDPKKAMLYSIVLPGLGQAYNKSWWKIPVIYAGLGTCAYFAITNGKQYNNFHNALIDLGNHKVDQLNSIYLAGDLVNGENYYKRYRDLSYIAAAFVYLLNIVDANVDAQLHNFDVSDNISFRFTPQLNMDMTGRYIMQPGFCFIKKF